MKLSEMKEKKSGDYYSVDDVLGEEITILEECNQSTNFREYVFKPKDGNEKKNKPYACLLIRHTEEKDLHITNYAMVALSEVMPQNPAESWRGYKVRINKLGTGTNLKYKIAVVGKTLEASMPLAPPAAIVDSSGQLVGLLKHAPAGMEDAALWKAAIAMCGSMAAAMAVVEKLRAEGKIINLGGNWGAT